MATTPNDGADHSVMRPGNGKLPTILYLHIPKAAGTTLATLLTKRVDCGRALRIENTRNAAEELASVPQAERDRLELVRGHFAYGLHEGLRQPFEYITMLRDPVGRLISHYHYVLRKPAHYLYRRVTSEKMTLKDYAAAGLARELDNGQVRLISGAFYRDPVGQCSRDRLERAKENLRNQFAVVGLAERFDETMLLLGDRYGWKDMRYVSKNVTPDRTRPEQLPAGTIEAIRNANALDVELYNFAVELFEAAVQRQGNSFQERVAAFRRQIANGAV